MTIESAKKHVRHFLAAAILIAAISGCTTAMYGRPLELVSSNPDVYSFRVYIGGFSGGARADAMAKERIEEFMIEEEYNSYEVVDRKHILMPSSFEYTVRFDRQPESET